MIAPAVRSVGFVARTTVTNEILKVFLYNLPDVVSIKNKLCPKQKKIKQHAINEVSLR